MAIFNINESEIYQYLNEKKSTGVIGYSRRMDETAKKKGAEARKLSDDADDIYSQRYRAGFMGANEDDLDEKQHDLSRKAWRKRKERDEAESKAREYNTVKVDGRAVSRSDAREIKDKFRKNYGGPQHDSNSMHGKISDRKPGTVLAKYEERKQAAEDAKRNRFKFKPKTAAQLAAKKQDWTYSKPLSKGQKMADGAKKTVSRFFEKDKK